MQLSRHTPRDDVIRVLLHVMQPLSGHHAARGGSLSNCRCALPDALPFARDENPLSRGEHRDRLSRDLQHDADPCLSPKLA